MTDIAALTSAVTQLIGTFGGTRDEMQDLLGGTVDGGPNGTGDYPVTTSGGAVVLLPCWRKMLLGGGTNPNEFVGVGAVIAATIGADVGQIRLTGWQSAGDGGGNIYNRVAAKPAHGGYIVNKDGAIFELAAQDSRPEYFGYDLAADDDARDRALEAANFFAYVKGRKVFLYGKKIYVTRGYNHYPGVITDGSGSVMGSDPMTMDLVDAATIMLADNTNPIDTSDGMGRSSGVCRKAFPKSRGWRLMNVNIDGNKANNTRGHCLYLYAAADGVLMTGDNDENAYLDGVVLRNAPEDGLNIGAAGTIDGKTYNIRQVNIGKLIIRACGGWGMNSLTWTDSSIDTVAISGCGLGAKRAVSFANNHISGVIKGFYNGNALGSGTNPARDINQYSFKFFNSGRGFWRIECQEEFASGVYMENCYSLTGQVLADACGFPAGSTGSINARGVQIHNPSNLEMDVIADSFHATDATPFLQAYPVAISSSAGFKIDNLVLRAKYRNQKNMTISKSLAGDLGKMMIVDNGALETFNSSLTDNAVSIYNEKTLSRKSGFRGYVTTDTDDDGLQVDVGGTSTTGKWLDIFRRTLTTGARGVRIFRGDGSNTLDHRVTPGGSVEVSLAQGAAWNTGHFTLGAWHLWVDGQGCLRQKAGQPTSATDGAVIAQMLTTPPAAANSPGVKGQAAFDDGYLYSCVQKDTWRRTPLAAW